MDSLSNQLLEADKICKKAHSYFERANSLRQKRFTRFRTINAVLAFFAIMAFFSIVVLTILAQGKVTLKDSLLLLAGIALVYYILSFLVKYSYDKEMERVNRVDEKGMRILQENAEKLAFLPDDYWYPLATSYLYKITVSNRADTLNEALSMFDEQLHRWRMEESNAELATQLAYQTRALRGIQQSIDINTMTRLYPRR